MYSNKEESKTRNVNNNNINKKTIIMVSTITAIITITTTITTGIGVNRRAVEKRDPRLDFHGFKIDGGKRKIKGETQEGSSRLP